jgi:GT2 family glycosyltransferase
VFFIRSSVFNELKGFDDEFFAHQEEIDLCWRALNKGIK